MVDPNLVVVLGHVIDTDKFAQARVKMAANAFAKECSAELSLLSGCHGYALCRGKDNATILFLLLHTVLGGSSFAR